MVVALTRGVARRRAAGGLVPSAQSWALATCPWGGPALGGGKALCCPLQLLTHAEVCPCVTRPWPPPWQCPRVCFCFPWARHLPGLPSCLVPSLCPLPQPLTLGPGRCAAARHGLKADTKHPPSSGVVGERGPRTGQTGQQRDLAGCSTAGGWWP